MTAPTPELMRLADSIQSTLETLARQCRAIGGSASDYKDSRRQRYRAIARDYANAACFGSLAKHPRLRVKLEEAEQTLIGIELTPDAPKDEKALKVPFRSLMSLKRKHA